MLTKNSAFNPMVDVQIGKSMGFIGKNIVEVLVYYAAQNRFSTILVLNEESSKIKNMPEYHAYIFNMRNEGFCISLGSASVDSGVFNFKSINELISSFESNLANRYSWINQHEISDQVNGQTPDSMITVKITFN